MKRAITLRSISGSAPRAQGAYDASRPTRSTKRFRSGRRWAWNPRVVITSLCPICFANVQEGRAWHQQPARERMPKIVGRVAGNARLAHRLC
jgi:hypothetical protein